MKIETTFLRSRVAQRVLLSFILAALLPVLTAGALAFFKAVEILNEQAHLQLHSISKQYAHEVLERLLLAESYTRELANTRGMNLGEATSSGSELFSNAAVVPALALSRTEIAGPALTQAELDRLWSGHTVLITVPLPENTSRIWLYTRIHGPEEPWALRVELRPEAVWGRAEALPYAANILAMDETGAVLFAAPGTVLPPTDRIQAKLWENASGTLRWSSPVGDMLTSYRHLFLQAQFERRGWAILAGQPEASALAPLASFKTMVPLTAGVILLLVALLAAAQIRRPPLLRHPD